MPLNNDALKSIEDIVPTPEPMPQNIPAVQPNSPDAPEPATAPEATGAASISPKDIVPDMFSLGDLFAVEKTELDYLYKPYFLRTGLFVIVGEADSGKSTFLRQLCMSVASGRNFLGMEYCGLHNKAIYFSSEDGKELTAAVVKRYNKTMQIPPEAAGNLLFKFSIDPETMPQEISTILDHFPADVLVIDAFGDAFDGVNINDSLQVRKFYAPFNAIAEEHECLIIFNHHAGKRTSSNAPSKDNALGSQSVIAKPRAAAEIRRDFDDDELLHFCIIKANYLPADLKRSTLSFRMDENIGLYRTEESKDKSALAAPPAVNGSTAGRKTQLTPELSKTIVAGIPDSGFGYVEFWEHIMASTGVKERTAKEYVTQLEKDKFVLKIKELDSKKTHYFKRECNISALVQK